MLNVVALVRAMPPGVPAQRFVVIFDDDGFDAALRQLSRWASDPEIPFTWYDAALLAQRARRLMDAQRFDR